MYLLVLFILFIILQGITVSLPREFALHLKGIDAFSTDFGQLVYYLMDSGVFFFGGYSLKSSSSSCYPPSFIFLLLFILPFLPPSVPFSSYFPFLSPPFSSSLLSSRLPSSLYEHLFNPILYQAVSETLEITLAMKACVVPCSMMGRTSDG